MHVSDCRSNVRVSARTKQAVYAGGLAGKAAAFDVDKLDTNYVTDCVNEGQITAHSADAQAVNEHAKPYLAAAGGLIGYAEGTCLKGCENRGLITTKTELSLEKEIDTLPSTSTAGGLVGYFDGGAIENGRNLSGCLLYTSKVVRLWQERREEVEKASQAVLEALRQSAKGCLLYTSRCV